MKSWAIFSGLVVIAGLLLSPHADARSVTGRVSHERMRIRHGVRNHSLSPAEARRLRYREMRLTRRYRRDRRDGHGLTWAERRRMERGLHRQSRRIHHQRHD